jgi:RNA polymerase sigma-70 factor (ECF subfamily)
MTLPTSTRVARSSDAPVPVPRLPRQEAVLEALAARGVDLRPSADEDAEAFEARIETALMAHFRDLPGEESFTALHEYARDELLETVRRCLGSRRAELDPAEALQDVFVNVYRYAGSFRDEQPRSFRVWSSVIARNVVRRKLSRRRRLSLEDLPEGWSEPADPRRGPVLRLCCEEERRAITEAWGIVLRRYLAAYESLSPRDRRALDLIEVQGLSYAEGARRLEVGLSNMKMILFRARKRIRQHIACSLGAALAAADAERLAG